MKNRQRNLRLSSWLMLALMIGSILSPTISLANTVESTTSSEEQTANTLQTLSSDPLLPEATTEATTESTTASSEMETADEAVEPVITYGAETIDENELKLHEDQKNPQPSIKEQKIEQVEDRVHFSGKLFAGVDETEKTRSTTAVTSFELQRKASSGEWETVKEWLEQEVAIQEEDYPFETEVLLVEDEVTTFRYVIKYKVNAHDQENQSLIEEKNNKGYFLVEDEYSYQKKVVEDKAQEFENTTISSNQSDEHSKEEVLVTDSNTSDGELNESTKNHIKIPSIGGVKSKSRYSSLGIQPFGLGTVGVYDTQKDIVQNTALGQWNDVAISKIGSDGVSISGRFKLNYFKASHVGGVYGTDEDNVYAIHLLYKEQGQTVWQKKGTIATVATGSEINISNATFGGFTLGKTFDFAIGYDVEEKRLWDYGSHAGYQYTKSSYWTGPFSGGTIVFPPPPSPAVGVPVPSSIKRKAADISCQIDNSVFDNKITSVHIRKASDATYTELNVIDNQVIVPNGSKNGISWAVGHAFISGTDTLKLTLHTLESNTKYIVRVVILTSEGGTVYSSPSEADFTTLPEPSISNANVSSIGATRVSAVCAVDNSDGNNGISQFQISTDKSNWTNYEIRGGYANKAPDNTTWTSGGAPTSGSGNMTIDVIGLLPDTQYYIRGQLLVTLSEGNVIVESTKPQEFRTKKLTVGGSAISGIGATRASLFTAVDNCEGNNGIAKFQLSTDQSTWIDYEMRANYVDQTPDNVKWTGGGAPSTGFGGMSANIIGLTPNTKYYIRAQILVTFDNNTSYIITGEETNFTTKEISVGGSAISNIGTTKASLFTAVDNCEGNNGVSKFQLSTDKLTWVDYEMRTNYVDQTPDNVKWTGGGAPSTGFGGMSANIIGLTPNTKYYVRAQILVTFDNNVSHIVTGVETDFKTNYTVKEQYYDLSGNHIKTKENEVLGNSQFTPTPPNSFTHSGQAYIYKGWLKESEWDGNSATPMPALRTGAVDPLTTHDEEVYLIYDLDSNSLRLDEYPNKFDFGNQHRPESYNQIFNLDDSKYASTESTDGFKLRVRDDRATHPGWKLTSTFSQLVGVNNTSDQLVGAKISFGVELKEIQNPGTPGETAITPTPAIAPSFGAPVSSSTATLTADGTALTFLSASNTKGEGVWDVLIDFDSVKLFVPAGQGNTGEEYQGTIQWDLEDTP